MDTVLFKVDGGRYTFRRPGPFAVIALFIQSLTGRTLPAARRYLDTEQKHWLHHVNRLQAELDREQYQRKQAERLERLEANDLNELNGLKAPERTERVERPERVYYAFGKVVPNDFIQELLNGGTDPDDITTEYLEALLWYDYADNDYQAD